MKDGRCKFFWKLRVSAFWGKKKSDCWCLTDEDCHVRICRWVSLIVVVWCDCVKTSDQCNDVSISLSLERDCVQGEV